jgi:phosphatidate cytidylyltransferase
MIIKLIVMVVCLFAFGAGLITLSHTIRRSEKKQRRNDWLKYFLYMTIICSMLAMARLGKEFLGVMLFIIAIVGAIELYLNLKIRGYLAIIIFLMNTFLLLVCLGHLLLWGSHEWFRTFSFVFLLVGITDSYSQLWGKLLGKQKLCPHVSPQKTWQGLIGGIFTTLAAALLFSFLIPELKYLLVLGLGLIIALAATIGDLIFSYIKRKLLIKDFSSIIPGHGGVLDRFDSLIITAPIFYWCEKFVL